MKIIKGMLDEAQHLIWKYQDELFWTVIIVGGIYLIQGW